MAAGTAESDFRITVVGVPAAAVSCQFMARVPGSVIVSQDDGASTDNAVLLSMHIIIGIRSVILLTRIRLQQGVCPFGDVGVQTENGQ